MSVGLHKKQEELSRRRTCQAVEKLRGTREEVGNARLPAGSWFLQRAQGSREGAGVQIPSFRWLHEPDNSWAHGQYVTFDSVFFT